MLPETHPLIEAVTEPLADNAEQRLAAHALLRETFEPDHPSAGGTLERLRKADSRRLPGLWRLCLHICAGIAICLMVFSTQSFRKGYRTITGLASMGSHHGYPTAALPENLTPGQELLLGDPSLSDLEQKERLLASDPERPAFHAEFAGEYFQVHDKLPEGYLETAARIDPDNAFFLHIAAGRDGGDSIGKIKSAAGRAAPPRIVDGKRLKAIPVETKWEVKDQAEFDRAMELISRASRLPRFESYETSMAAERLELLGQESYLERIRTLAFAASRKTQIIPIMKVADLFSAKAYLLSLQGEEEKFLALADELEGFLGQLAASPDSSMVGELVYRVIASTTANSFHFAAQRLGRSELEEKYGERRKAFIEFSDFKELREDTIGDKIQERSSLLNSLMLPMLARQAANPPPVSPDDLAPGRWADYELFSSALSYLAAILIGIASLVVMQLRIRSSKSLGLIARRFTLLLTRADWAWILGCGVIAPIAIVLCLTRFTPLGGRDFSIRHSLFLFPTVHYALVVLLLITLPVFLIRWRLGKRIRPFGLQQKSNPLFLIVPALGSLAMLLAHPVIIGFSLSRATLALLAIFPALWLIGILVGAGMILFGKPAGRLRRALPLPALAAAYSLSIIILAALQPYFRASADRWVARDHFGRVVASGLTTYEAEVAAEIRKETNAILGLE